MMKVFDFPKYRIWMKAEGFWACGNYETLEQANRALKHLDPKYKPTIMELIDLNDQTHGYVEVV